MDSSKETDQCVPHECYTTSLRSAVEKCDLGLVGLQGLCVLECRFPGGLFVDGLLVVILDRELSASLAINFDLVALRRDDKSRLVGRSKAPGPRVSLIYSIFSQTS